MKRVAPVILLLMLLLIITACNASKLENSLEIGIQFRVSNLTDKEFESVGTKGLENPTKDDFKNIEFALDVAQSNKVLNRKIIIPDINKAANSYDRERYWFGQSYGQDNAGENFAKYGNKFVFYSKGLNEQDIKKTFDSAEVKVFWATRDGSCEEKMFKLGDIIQFRN